jgi:uncharacterized protein YcaQ
VDTLRNRDGPREDLAFDFDYQLEMYKPKAKRRWGFFALPILYGDRLVGKLAATADRKAGVLRVDAIYEDVAFSKTMPAAVRREINDLAGSNWISRCRLERRVLNCFLDGIATRGQDDPDSRMSRSRST